MATAINFFRSETARAKPAVMISRCLLGDKVRYDGKDQKLETLALLADKLELISCCPEVGAGLSVPRPPVQLVQNARRLIARGRDDHSLDVTSELQGYSRQSLASCPGQLCGYVFKSRSPSCGLGSTPIYNDGGQPIALGNGIQAEHYQHEKPWLIAIEETDLASTGQCQRFIAYCRIIWEGLNCPVAEYQNLLNHYEIEQAAVSDRQLFLMQLKAGLTEE